MTRAGKTLPISEVPNLQSGDRLWIHPAFPDNESVHYVLAVAFLQGATNPPPDNWFTKAETWTRQVRKEGIVVTVPEHAQQALFFLAPQTGGRLQHSALGGPGKAGSLCARRTGPESRKPEPFARGEVPECEFGEVRKRSQSAP